MIDKELKFFHGSHVGGICELIPQVSQHEKPYVYLTTNEVLAVLYTVSGIWYSYGFNDEGVPVYDEWYPNALHDIYSKKVGYIYSCGSAYESCKNNESCASAYEWCKNNESCASACESCGSDCELVGLEDIPTVFVSSKPIRPSACIEIMDVYQKLLEYESEGLLIIRSYNTLSDKLKNWYFECAEREIAANMPTSTYLKSKINLIPDLYGIIPRSLLRKAAVRQRVQGLPWSLIPVILQARTCKQNP